MSSAAALDAAARTGARGRARRGRGRRAGAPARRRRSWRRRCSRRLRELAMPHAEIAVQVGEHDDDDPGDHVAFLLAANPGSPLLPLTRVASGGELARTMLALRLALDEHGGRPAGSTARVRRGRRRHRRHRGGRRRRGAGRGSATTRRCSSSPTSPRSRRSPTTQYRVDKTCRPAAPRRSRRRAGRRRRPRRRDRPHALRAPTSARRPGSTPRSCCDRRDPRPDDRGGVG